MKSGKRVAPARDIDAYLARVPAQPRATLQKLRKIIRAAAPKAIECISYAMPAYRYHGMLVYFAAFKNHCSFYPGAAVLKAHQNELRAYGTSKGTIRFPIDKPLPTVLVKKLVKARVKENEARHLTRKSRNAS